MILHFRRGALVLAGVLLASSSIAHAVLGWGTMAEELRALDASDDLIGGLASGWLFGSVSMAVFAAVVLGASIARFRHRSASSWPLGCIAVGCILFGAAATLGRGFSPHFLGFMVIGALVAAGAPGETA